MRVWVVIGNGTQSGGGFQHEMAIIENLKEHASNCGHKFYIFSYNFLFDEKKLKCDHLKFIKVAKDVDVLRAKAGVLARQRVENKFTRDQQEDNYLELYDQILDTS